VDETSAIADLTAILCRQRRLATLQGGRDRCLHVDHGSKESAGPHSSHASLPTLLTFLELPDMPLLVGIVGTLDASQQILVVLLLTGVLVGLPATMAGSRR
jgi:hypothetical protein